MLFRHIVFVGIVSLCAGSATEQEAPGAATDDDSHIPAVNETGTALVTSRMYSSLTLTILSAWFKNFIDLMPNGPPASYNDDRGHRSHHHYYYGAPYPSYSPWYRRGYWNDWNYPHYYNAPRYYDAPRHCDCPPANKPSESTEKKKKDGGEAAEAAGAAAVCAGGACTIAGKVASYFVGVGKFIAGWLYFIAKIGGTVAALEAAVVVGVLLMDHQNVPQLLKQFLSAALPMDSLRQLNRENYALAQNVTRSSVDMMKPVLAQLGWEGNPPVSSNIEYID